MKSETARISHEQLTMKEKIKVFWIYFKYFVCVYIYIIYIVKRGNLRVNSLKYFLRVLNSVLLHECAIICKTMIHQSLVNFMHNSLV